MCFFPSELWTGMRATPLQAFAHGWAIFRSLSTAPNVFECSANVLTGSFAYSKFYHSTSLRATYYEVGLSPTLQVREWLWSRPVAVDPTYSPFYLTMGIGLIMTMGSSTKGFYVGEFNASRGFAGSFRELPTCEQECPGSMIGPWMSYLLTYRYRYGPGYQMLGSSLSNKIIVKWIFPAFNFLWMIANSPRPSLSLSTPVANRSFARFVKFG